MEQHTKYLNYDVSGSDRKLLVHTIAAHTHLPFSYLGAPSFSYEVGPYRIDSKGVVYADDSVEPTTLTQLQQALEEHQFFALDAKLECDQPEEAAGVSISLPVSLFSQQNLENLQNLLISKGDLIRKALEVDALPVEVQENQILFPWFDRQLSEEETKAYTHFVASLCALARNQHKIACKQKPTVNEKYTFRCFLLRLGFIGPEYKDERKILLRNLSGSSAYKQDLVNASDLFDIKLIPQT